MDQSEKNILFKSPAFVTHRFGTTFKVSFPAFLLTAIPFDIFSLSAVYLFKAV